MLVKTSWGRALSFPISVVCVCAGQVKKDSGWELSHILQLFSIFHHLTFLFSEFKSIYKSLINLTLLVAAATPALCCWVREHDLPRSGHDRSKRNMRNIWSQCFPTCQITSVLSACKFRETLVHEWVFPGHWEFICMCRSDKLGKCRSW